MENGGVGRTVAYEDIVTGDIGMNSRGFQASGEIQAEIGEENILEMVR